MKQRCFEGYVFILQYLVNRGCDEAEGHTTSDDGLLCSEAKSKIEYPLVFVGERS